MCYIRIDPNVNEWVTGTIVRQVVGVPNSFVIDVDGHKYRRNKRDLTLVPPKPITMRVMKVMVTITTMIRVNR